MKSLLYIFSAVLLMMSFVLYPKAKGRLQLLQWTAVTLFGYELFACFVGAGLTILNIPADIGSVSVVNFLVGAALLYGIKKTKRIQQYSISIWEIVGIVTIAAMVFAVGWYRFDGFSTLNYETSDPAVHMRMAMDCVNYRTVTSDEGGMIIAQFTNALWIEWLQPFFDGAYRFKSYILKDVYNLFLAGMVFYASFRPTDKKSPCWQIFLVTVAYLAGYPLSNLLFGFQYLGLGVTAVCFLFLCAKLYSAKNVNKSWTVCLMNLGCIGSSLSYTLFAPVVYIALFCFLAWEYFREQKVKLTNKAALIDVIKLQLSVFVIPTVVTLYFIVVVQLMTKWDVGLDTALTYEGYIYRNLYSDFIIVLPFAVYGWWAGLREKKIDLLTFLLPLEFLYSGFFFLQMLSGETSTYYYYKFNYLNAIVIYGLGVVGVARLCENAQAIVNSYLMTWLLIFSMWFTGTIDGLNLQNVHFAPFTDEASMFRIVETNRFYLSRNASNHDWIILSDAMLQIGEEDKTNLILGDWLSSYWYEALADEKIKPNYAYSMGAQRFMDMFINDMSYGDYLAVISGSAEEAAVLDRLEKLEVVFQCDSGYIVKRDS